MSNRDDFPEVVDVRVANIVFEIDTHAVRARFRRDGRMDEFKMRGGDLVSIVRGVSARCADHYGVSAEWFEREILERASDLSNNVIV